MPTVSLHTENRTFLTFLKNDINLRIGIGLCIVFKEFQTECQENVLHLHFPLKILYKDKETPNQL